MSYETILEASNVWFRMDASSHGFSLQPGPYIHGES